MEVLRPTHFAPQRPWLALYDQFLRKTVSEDEAAISQVPLALIQHLPDELLIHCISVLPPYILGKLACVCKHWRGLVEHPKLWEHACMDAFQLTHPVKSILQRMVTTSYRRSWKRLFLEHPHMRFDGLYVSRNTYVRTGVSEWSRQRPVHVVVYYRYYRFFPDGTLLYRTSPITINKIARSMMGPKPAFFQEDQVTPLPALAHSHIFVGRYLIRGSKVWSVVRYPNSWSTEIRVRMSLRSTTPGANNRLDVESLQSYDRELGVGTAVDGGGGGREAEARLDAEPNGDGVTRREHRCPACCVFVPWEQVQKSVLNLPASEMDFFMTG